MRACGVDKGDEMVHRDLLRPSKYNYMMRMVSMTKQHT